MVDRRYSYYANGESMENYLSCGIWEDGHDIGENITVSMQWSRKIKEGGQTRGYKDYKEKIETYIDEVAGQADSIKPGVLESAREVGILLKLLTVGLNT